MTRIAGVLVTVLTAAVLTGCAAANPQADSPAASASATPSATPTPVPTSSPTGGPTGEPTTSVPAPTGQRVIVQRSGGIAGMLATLAVEANGHWVYGTGKDAKGSQTSGQLTSAQTQQLATLVANPLLGPEQAKSKPAGVCNDTFVYKVVAGSSMFIVDDCYQSAYPAAYAIVSFLSANTAL